MEKDFSKKAVKENKIQSLLCSLGICNDHSIELLYPKVRDRDDVAVMKCNKSGVIFLSRSDHIDISHYEKQNDFKYWSVQDRKQVLIDTLEDNQRRANQFQSIISNKKWLDVGTGVGGILDILSSIAAETIAIEPQEKVRKELLEQGYTIHPNLDNVPNDHFEVVTLFHVFEHFTEPLKTLKTILKKLILGGKIIIEVPHANDFLISFLDLDSFKSFTFWSEHLILHTRQSLTVFLKESGFKNICIEGFQRYPLANHLHWLVKEKPGGHQIWNYLRTPDLDNAYAQMLARLDKTDTLIAIAEK